MEFKLSEQGKPTQTTSSVGSDIATQERQWLSGLRDELNDYYKRVENFATSDPADVMAEISSIGARCTHIRALLQRSASQKAVSLRTKELDPLIESLEFQFKVHSRIIALAEFEFKVSGGAN